MDCHLRPATASDKPFLYSLHCVTMREPIQKIWGWDEAWQRSDFEQRFGECDVSIIEADGEDVGCLWLRSEPDVTFIADLQVNLPAMQGRGIGTSVLQGLVAHASARGIPVELAVLQINPRAKTVPDAGVQVIEDGDPFVHMLHDGTG